MNIPAHLSVCLYFGPHSAVQYVKIFWKLRGGKKTQHIISVIFITGMKERGPEQCFDQSCFINYSPCGQHNKKHCSILLFFYPRVPFVMWFYIPFQLNASIYSKTPEFMQIILRFIAPLHFLFIYMNAFTFLNHPSP